MSIRPEEEDEDEIPLLSQEDPRPLRHSVRPETVHQQGKQLMLVAWIVLVAIVSGDTHINE